MADLRGRVRLPLLVAGLVAAATASMVADRRARSEGARELPPWASPLLDAVVPLQKAIALPIDFVRHAWSGYVALLDVGDQNAQLVQRIHALEEENLQLREALVAGGRLARIAEMRADFEVPMLPTQLVGSDVSAFFRSVLVDRGRSQGVRSGMPVISEEGVVGLVTATSERAARTTLLLDRQTAIDGTVQRSRTRGIVRGRGSDVVEFEFVSRGADVAVGDVVITSGLDGVYPKGLRVGTVSAVAEADAGLLRSATLVPAVDFGRLEQAFVILRRGPSMELLYRTEGGDGEAQTAAAGSGPAK
jgi:rod shape-determining protein MreC